jgi:hypothetical protein
MAPSDEEEPVLEDGLRLVLADVTLTMTLSPVRRMGFGGRGYNGIFPRTFLLVSHLKFSQDLKRTL